MRFCAILFFGLAGVVATSGELCGRERLPLLAPGVSGSLHLPSVNKDKGEPLAAIVILHGVGGMRRICGDEARILTEHGYAALVLDYYAGVHWGGSTVAERMRRWRAWEDAVVAAVAYLRARPEVDPQRLALLGISQGGALALTSATRVSGLAAVVDYFGPHPRGWYVGGFLGQRTVLEKTIFATLPPVLILHGTWDPVVAVGNSRRLYRDLEDQGVAVDLRIYPRALHAFNDADCGLSNSTAIADDARRRVLDFLATHLAVR